MDLTQAQQEEINQRHADNAEFLRNRIAFHQERLATIDEDETERRAVLLNSIENCQKLLAKVENWSASN